MRVVIVGASNLAAATAESLTRRGHEVVIVERDRARIDELGERLDAAFVAGDGIRPSILKETSPEECEALLALTSGDQDNILAALVGRSVGFQRVLPKVSDPELENVAIEVGLTELLVPDRAMAQAIADRVEGGAGTGAEQMIPAGFRLFTFIATMEDAEREVLKDLPRGVKPLAIFRGDGFVLPSETDQVHAGDRVLLILPADRYDDMLAKRAKGKRRG